MLDHVQAFPENIKDIKDDNASPVYREIVAAFELLLSAGIITLGTESPGDQFFVMKYKDRFTAAGLQAYAEAVLNYAYSLRTLPPSDETSNIASSLHEYASQVRDQADLAYLHGKRIPD